MADDLNPSRPYLMNLHPLERKWFELSRLTWFMWADLGEGHQKLLWISNLRPLEEPPAGTQDSWASGQAQGCSPTQGLYCPPAWPICDAQGLCFPSPYAQCSTLALTYPVCTWIVFITRPAINMPTPKRRMGTMIWQMIVKIVSGKTPWGDRVSSQLKPRSFLPWN